MSERQDTSLDQAWDNAHYAVAGFGMWYFLKWIFAFYPAWITGLYICQQTDPSWGESGAVWSGVVFTAIIFVFISFLMVLAKEVIQVYYFLGFMYLITLWPFIHQINCYLNNVQDNNECFPLPPVDWWPFW